MVLTSLITEQQTERFEQDFFDNTVKCKGFWTFFNPGSSYSGTDVLHVLLLVFATFPNAKATFPEKPKQIKQTHTHKKWGQF